MFRWRFCTTAATGIAPITGFIIEAQATTGHPVSIPSGSVPRVVLHVPSDFRRVPPGHQRISHEELNRNWETWEKEKHWDKQAHVQQTKAVSGGGKGDNQQGKGRGKGKHKD